MSNSADVKDCCPEFDRTRWDEKTFKWEKQPFIKDSIPTLFHIQFPPMIKKKITAMAKEAKDAGVNPEKEDWLVLFSDPHPFKSELFMGVTAPIEANAKNVNISGSFATRVYDGPYNAVAKFMKDMNLYLQKKGKEAKKYYVHYAYCPECAKKIGHNYMILFAEI